MVLCGDFEDLKIVIRSILVACMEALTVEELWDKLTRMYDGPQSIQTKLFGFDTFFELLKNIPDVVKVKCLFTCTK